jgi:drug/metabolite transporter (DMT)-like permease
VCVAAGVTGVALIQQPHVSAGNFATVAAFVSSFFSAVAMLGLNRLGHVDHRAIVVHFSTVATAVCVIALFVCEQQHPYQEMLDAWTILALVGTGVSAAVGQLFLTRAYAEGTPSKVAVVGLTQIVLSLALDALLFKHGFNAMTLLGIGLVVGPTAWVLLRPAVPHADKVTS